MVQLELRLVLPNKLVVLLVPLVTQWLKTFALTLKSDGAAKAALCRHRLLHNCNTSDFRSQKDLPACRPVFQTFSRHLRNDTEIVLNTTEVVTGVGKREWVKVKHVVLGGGEGDPGELGILLAWCILGAIKPLVPEVVCNIYKYIATLSLLIVDQELNLPWTWNPTSLNLNSDRFGANLGVHNVELFSNVVHHPFHPLLARVNVANHLEQLVAIVEVMEEGHSVTVEDN